MSDDPNSHDLTFTASVVKYPFDDFVDGIVRLGEHKVFEIDLTQIPEAERSSLLDERFAEALFAVLEGGFR